MATKSKKQQRQRGYTLLEYCAGAAVMAGILFTTLDSLREKFGTLTTAIGTWATARAMDLNRTSGTAGQGNG
jgi:hypothetical protein